jgi:S-adenosylmethionine hydrolase
LPVNIDTNSKTISGNVDTMDAQFGNLWTNITNSDFKKLNLPAGTDFLVKIKAHENTVYSNIIRYGNTFADVDKSEPIIFLNSVYCLAIAINQGNFVTQAGLMTHIGNLTIEFKAIEL